MLLQESSTRYNGKAHDLFTRDQALLAEKPKPQTTIVSQPKSLKEILEKMGLVEPK